MEMEFVRHEPCYDRILFVLTLDRKKMKERILIGEELQVRFRLQGDMDADVLCDTTRPLGTFLGSAEGCPALKPLEAASLRAGRRGISENKV